MALLLSCICVDSNFRDTRCNYVTTHNFESLTVQRIFLFCHEFPWNAGIALILLENSSAFRVSHYNA